jgi:hypothetical protein
MNMSERRLMHPDLSFRIMVWALGALLALLAIIASYAGRQFASLVDKFENLSGSVQELARVTAESTAERKYTQLEISRIDGEMKQVSSTLTQHMLDDNKRASALVKHTQEDQHKFSALISEGGTR